MYNEIIEKVKRDFNKKKKIVKKIFLNTSTNEILVLAPTSDVDGIYRYRKNSDMSEPFVPSEDFKFFNRVAQDDNLIYEDNELDDMVHSSLSHAKSKLFGTKQENTKYYNRIGEPGKYRYFYTKAEWDAYQREQEGKKYDEWKKQQEAKKKAEIAQKNYEAGRKAEEGRKVEEARRWRKIALENNPHKTYAAEEAKKAGEGYQKWLDEQRKEKEWKENLFSDSTKKIEEEKRQNTIAALESRKQYKENTEYMKNDPNSPYNKISDIIDVMTDPVALYKLVEDGKLLDQCLSNDIVIDQVYEEMREWRQNEEIDPITGFHIKNYSLPIEDEMKLVNPGYYYTDQTGMLGENGDYSMNCYACTQAMALRMKGYDVSAGPDDDGIDVSYYSYNGKVNWKDPQYDENDPELGVSYNSLWTGNFSETKTFNNTLNDMKKEPPGSYGDFNMSIYLDAGTDGKFGTDDDNSFSHSIFYQVDKNGKLHFYDCQSGTEFSEATMLSFAEIATTDREGNAAYYTAYKRLDNQTYTGAALTNSGKVDSSAGGSKDEEK